MISIQTPLSSSLVIGYTEQQSVLPYFFDICDTLFPNLIFFGIAYPDDYTETTARKFLYTLDRFIENHSPSLAPEHRPLFANPQSLSVEQKEHFFTLLYGQILITCFEDCFTFRKELSFNEKVGIIREWLGITQDHAHEKEAFYASFCRCRPEECEELNCQDKALHFIPEEIARLRNLKTLNLSNNYLTFIPRQLSQLTQLQDLHLDHNLLTSTPIELQNLTALRVVTLSHNYFKEIPSLLLCSHDLEHLDVSYNKLQKIPSWVGTFMQLKQLILNDNAQIQTIPDSINRLAQLQFLDCRQCNLQSFPDIADLHYIKWLDVSNNHITHISSLAGCMNLNVLDLSNNHLSHIPLLNTDTLAGFSIINNPLEEDLDSRLMVLQDKFLQQSELH